MPFINIAQPEGNAKHITVTLSYNRVLLTTNNDMWTMDYYDATELARILYAAANKLEMGEMQ